ncbi:related to Endopolyphosphatase [Saccharomycodes ludwigii]|uniref:Endopolyphosphatase n=1 Tax=Saccharomycodes ludwigii TaxID=36035 RepID=A0A376BCM1_9ASCO|nr:hypothetical protein SCDLUD_004935 [Saccharomycodes ludwigii]KAH3899490.1 hypothetical protein SCDLUD_004935 [Saccharomycodes ludwigii]SSD61870.1 related to Endopolyphosphatase [Saccharomycodes ludwigii]
MLKEKEKQICGRIEEGRGDTVVVNKKCNSATKKFNNKRIFISLLLLLVVVVIVLPTSSIWNLQYNKNLPLCFKKLLCQKSISLKSTNASDVTTSTRRKLRGKFLHITDIHPDPLYKEGSSIKTACHRFTKKSGANDDDDFASLFTDPMVGCDSSLELMYHTMDWVVDNLKDEIDFVIWTGDNIRHDNDRKNPRTESSIFDLNTQLSDMFYDSFKKVPPTFDPMDMDVKVIPSIGNNDVYPHNMFAIGPTLQTREFYNIWNKYIPQEQQRSFNRFVSFFEEVIPGKLAVLSINTLYLYKANPLVDNCNQKSEPGYQLILWLGYVLQEMRERNIKVWLSGHVPPIEKNFETTCFHKFSAWIYEYRDIIIGGVYGHMNIDHFIPIDGKNSREEIQIYEEELSRLYDMDVDDDTDSSDARIMGAAPVNKVNYMRKIKKLYKDLDKSFHQGDGDDDEYCSKFSIVTIAGSVIPTFNPSFRVWEYNISGLNSEENILNSGKSWESFFDELEIKLQQDLMPDKDEDVVDILKKKKKKKPDKSIPPKMPSSLELGPAYKPQLFSPTGFTQYFADLNTINKNYYKFIDKDGLSKDEAAKKAFNYEIEYTSMDEDFPMDSLLVKDYIKYMHDLLQHKKRWKAYVHRAFISTDYENLDM